MIEAKIQLGGRLWKTPMILGHFVENLGDNIYGGIWDPSQPPSNLWLGGIRKDVLELVKSIRPQVIRFPGGCAADYYHWKFGIGPRKSRPVKPNYYWRWSGSGIGKPESYQFGTQEFLMFCEAVGAEPMLTVNAGTGTPEEAAEWVEFCNGDPSTRWGRVRASMGRREPWGVKLWCIGNEQWMPLEKGSCSPEKYGEKFLKFARAMRRVDPDIKLIACGLGIPWGESVWAQLLPCLLLRPLFEPLRPLFNPLNWKDWNRRLLKIAGHEIDALSIHDYFPDVMRLWHWRPKPTEENFYWVVTGNIKTERMLLRVQEEVEVPLCLDEWNVRYDLPSHRRCNYTVAEGLYTACMLNSLLRIKNLLCANYAQMINALGSIVTHESGAYLAPPGVVFRMYAENLRDTVLEVRVNSPEIETRSLRAPVVDAAAVEDRRGTSVFIVNRSYSESVTIRLKEEARETFTVGTAGPWAANSPSNPDLVGIERNKVKVRKDVLIIPPHTANCIRVS